MRNVTISGLTPSTEYQVWVIAKTKSPEISISSKVSLTTFSKISLPTIKEISPRNVSLNWISPADKELTSHQILYFPRKFPAKRNITKSVPTEPVQRYDYVLSGLMPGTEYVVQMVVKYQINDLLDKYVWPKGNTFVVSTILLSIMR